MPQMVPADVVNRSIDSLGSTKIIGSLADGTKDSEAARRAYGLVLRQLLRAAHWNFARKAVELLLLGDASGQSDPPVTSHVEPPWLYAYAWPTDAILARFVPQSDLPASVGIPLGNISLPSVPQNTATNPFPSQSRLIPTRFLVGSSDEYPSVIGETDWENMPDLTEGTGAIGRKVIFSNVANASLVYTKLALQIEEWDPLFSAAMDAALAARLAMIIVEDKKFARVLRNEQIAIARSALIQARVSNGNEGWSTTDHMPDWITMRSGGGWGDGLGWDGPGVFGYGWDAVSFGDGSAF